MKRAAVLALCLLAAPATAQQEPEAPAPEAEDGGVLTAAGAVIRVLDRVTGEIVDLDLDDGQGAGHGRIGITLGECRYPADNPSSDAYAYLTIRDSGAEADAAPLFAGWMIASSPALSALDHPRYDVWVLRCRSR